MERAQAAAKRDAGTVTAPGSLHAHKERADLHRYFFEYPDFGQELHFVCVNATGLMGAERHRIENPRRTPRVVDVTVEVQIAVAGREIQDRAQAFDGDPAGI
jgi:hypothetical protein